MGYTYKNLIVTAEGLREGKLADWLERGWELVAMVPYVMEPQDGKTYVREYWVTMRQPPNN
jgi:hypothetical protein